MKNENNTPINFEASTSKVTLGIPANLKRERSRSDSEGLSLLNDSSRTHWAGLRVVTTLSRRGSNYNLPALPNQESMGSNVSLVEQNINRLSGNSDHISKHDLEKLYDYINKITKEERHNVFEDTFNQLKEILEKNPGEINKILINRFFNKGWNVVSDDNSSLLTIAIEKATEADGYSIHDGNITFLLNHMKEELVLHFAAKSGQVKRLESAINLLEKREKLKNEINTQDKYGKTPLHYAAESGNKEILEFIINKLHELEFNIKEEINGQDKHEKTALHYAAESGNKDCFTLLLEKGARFSDDIYNRSELHFAAESGKIAFLEYLIELLKKKGTFKIEINKKDKYKNNVLHYAAKSGSKECIQNLISKSIFTKNKYGETPLHCIASIEKNKIDAEKYKGALEFLIGEITLIIDIKEELNQCNRRGDTPLHLAATHGNTACIEILIKQGTDINNQNNIDGSTALHCAVIHGHLDCVELLLSRGANADIKYKDGKTLVHLAAMYGHKDCLKFLVEKFPNDVRAVDDIDNTPLHLAFFYIQDSTNDIQVSSRKECIKLLTKKDVEINKPNSHGDTPLHLAAQFIHKECLEFLIAEMRKSMDLNEEIFRENKDKETVIHMAAFGGNIKCLEYLIEKIKRDEHGTEHNIKKILNQKNKYGDTLLHLAALSGSTECIEFIIDKMQDANIDIKNAIRSVNNKEESLLHLAALSGNTKCIELIMNIAERKGINIKGCCLQKDKKGHTVFHKAALGGSKECFELVMEEVKVSDLIDVVDVHHMVTESDNSNITPLHLAAVCFNVALTQYILEVIKKKGDAFLKRQINSKDCFGKTPLHYAVMNNSELNNNDDDDQFILQKRKENLRKKVIRSLLYADKERGKRVANCDIKDDNGNTVVDYVLNNSDVSILELFLNAFCERKEKLEQKYHLLEKKYQEPHKYVSRINGIIAPIMSIAVTIAILLRQSDSPIKIGASIIAIFCSCVTILGAIVGYYLERKENKLKSEIQNYSGKIKQIEDRIEKITGKGKKGYRTARERDELLDRLLDMYLPNISRRDQGDNKNTKQEHPESVRKRSSAATNSEILEKPSKPSMLKRILNEGKSFMRQDALSFLTPNPTPRHSISSQNASLTDGIAEAVGQNTQDNNDNLELISEKPSMLKRILNEGKSFMRQDALSFLTPNPTPRHSISSQNASLTDGIAEAVGQNTQDNNDNLELISEKPSIFKRMLKGKSITRQDAVALLTSNLSPHCTPQHAMLSPQKGNDELISLRASSSQKYGTEVTIIYPKEVPTVIIIPPSEESATSSYCSISNHK